MRKPRFGAAADGANRAVQSMATRVDGQTEEVAARAAKVITIAVRLLRFPTLALLLLPFPFILIVAAVAIWSTGALQVIAAVVAVVMSGVSGVLGYRRYRILKAVEDEQKLATELAIAVSLSGKVDETRLALGQITHQDGLRVFSRLRGVWNTAGLGTSWITGIGDLPRAKHFFPPTVGTTVTIAIAAAWLIPISFVAAIFLGIAGIAR